MLTASSLPCALALLVVSCAPGDTEPSVRYGEGDVARIDHDAARLIMYGRLIEPPYLFTGIGSDTLRLNGLPFAPRADPAPGSPATMKDDPLDPDPSHDRVVAHNVYIQTLEAYFSSDMWLVLGVGYMQTFPGAISYDQLKHASADGFVLDNGVHLAVPEGLIADQARHSSPN